MAALPLERLASAGLAVKEALVVRVVDLELVAARAALKVARGRPGAMVAQVVPELPVPVWLFYVRACQA